MAKLIKVPASLLLQEWMGKDYNEVQNTDTTLNKWTPQCSGPAHFAMKNLDFAIKSLRQCFTVHSLQRSSVQVAAALLEVASQKECHNPFLCLHQAAIFASQGSKGGNNDEFFKKEISREEECSPNEALGILGRADCMRAIHFTDEAIFLCSYVAKICCLHRDRERTDLVWSAKWRVVGIQMYIISVAIDTTMCSLMEGEVRIAALGTWEKIVREEILRGRSDAFALTRAIARKNMRKSRRLKNHSATNDPNKVNLNQNEDWSAEEYPEDEDREDYFDPKDDENISVQDGDNENESDLINKEIDATITYGRNDSVEEIMDLVPGLDPEFKGLAEEDYGEIPTVAV